VIEFEYLIEMISIECMLNGFMQVTQGHYSVYRGVYSSMHFEKNSSIHDEKLPKINRKEKKKKKRVRGMVFRKILKMFSHTELGE